MGFLRPLFAWFFSPFGLGLLAALDASLVFFLPFGVDAVLIRLAARDPHHAWLFAATAATGSVVGGTLTFLIGRRLGDDGVKRFVDERRLELFRKRFSRRVAISTAIAALVPPPFPFTAVLVTCGAIRARTVEVLSGLAFARLLRFAVEAWLAHRFGRSILHVMESAPFRWVIGGFIVLAVAGTTWSAWKIWRGPSAARGVVRPPLARKTA